MSAEWDLIEIARLQSECDCLRALVQEFVDHASGMEYDDWRIFVQRAREVLEAQRDRAREGKR